MSHYSDNYRECLSCGNQFNVWNRRRMGIGATECRDCARGLIPDRFKNAGPPSAEYVAALRAHRRSSGLCVECGSPPNGDALTGDLCRACVLAMEKEQEQIRRVS